MKENTFEALAANYQSRLNKAFYKMQTARVREEVETANLETHKVISAYARDLKRMIDDIMLRTITDHAKIQKGLQDWFGLDPEKAEVSFEMQRNTVRWMIRLTRQNEVYFYLSKRDTPVDIEKFHEWCMHIFT